MKTNLIALLKTRKYSDAFKKEIVSLFEREKVKVLKVDSFEKCFGKL